jgi:hypothetical protein
MKNILSQYNHTLIPSLQFAEACLLVSCRVLFYTERKYELFSLPRNGLERNFENLRLFLVQGTEFQVVFSSAEGFGTEFREYASIFVPRNGIPSCYLFRGKVRNGIPRGFCSAEQPEFRRKSPFVPSIPSSAELFFCRKFPTLAEYKKS